MACKVKDIIPIAKPCPTMATRGDLCKKHARIVDNIRAGHFDK